MGTFYSSPSPDAPPFVLVGQKVKEGDTLFIIEAMKTMNEVKSPCDGTVTRILAQPGDMVSIGGFKSPLYTECGSSRNRIPIPE